MHWIKNLINILDRKVNKDNEVPPVMLVSTMLSTTTTILLMLHTLNTDVLWLYNCVEYDRYIEALQLWGS